MPAHSEKKTIIQLTREKIELKNSEARSKVFEEGRRPDGRPYKVGVIDLPSFYMDMAAARAGRRDFKSTTRDVRKILEDFNRQGVDALVLDLRRNGGGSLQEAINLTGLFLGDGPIVQVKDSDGQVRAYNDQDGAMLWKGPMVVFISKFSASASEILAGAIQDYRRGLVVGDRATHGKGTVQSLMDLGELLFRNPLSSKLGALKVTMQQFYRPNGDSTQQRGVLADVEWPSLTTHLDVGEGDLDYPIPFDRVPAAEFHAYGFATKALADRLKQRSEERCAKSSDFDKVRRDIAHYEQQKKRKWVPLVEHKFLAERAELNADKEEEKKIEEMNDPSGVEIKKDHYLNEALAITADYLGLLGAAPAPQAAQAATAQER
jgi:carboxyl-terminal processing protease